MTNIISVSKVYGLYLLGLIAIVGIAELAVNRIMKKNIILRNIGRGLY